MYFCERGIIPSDKKPTLKAFQCPQCPSSYSRRLNEHKVKVHGEESQAHHRFLCPFNCSHNHRTILRHCEKEHKENLGIVSQSRADRS